MVIALSVVLQLLALVPIYRMCYPPLVRLVPPSVLLDTPNMTLDWKGLV